MVNYCLTCSEQYFSYIQDEHKFNNIVEKKYIEMRESMVQWLSIATREALESWAELGNNI
jgi:hypothetical protein